MRTPASRRPTARRSAPAARGVWGPGPPPRAGPLLGAGPGSGRGRGRGVGLGAPRVGVGRRAPAGSGRRGAEPLPPPPEASRRPQTLLSTNFRRSSCCHALFRPPCLTQPAHPEQKTNPAPAARSSGTLTAAWRPWWPRSPSRSACASSRAAGGARARRRPRPLDSMKGPLGRSTPAALTRGRPIPGAQRSRRPEAPGRPSPPDSRGGVDDAYYLSDKEDRCVACGARGEAGLLRKSIVPHWSAS
jgi:hypothetical protein